MWIEMQVGIWTQQLWMPVDLYQPEVFQLLFTQACAYLHNYFALPSTNCSYSEYLLQIPRSQSELRGQEASLCLPSCLAAGGVVLGVLTQCLHEIHPGSLWEMGSWCQHLTLPGRALQRLKRTILAAFPFKRDFSVTVSLLVGCQPPLPGRRAGALKTIEECDGKNPLDGPVLTAGWQLINTWKCSAFSLVPLLILIYAKGAPATLTAGTVKHLCNFQK